MAAKKTASVNKARRQAHSTVQKTNARKTSIRKQQAIREDMYSRTKSPTDHKVDSLAWNAEMGTMFDGSYDGGTNESGSVKKNYMAKSVLKATASKNPRAASRRASRVSTRKK
jgi:hypothetical protein